MREHLPNLTGAVLAGGKSSRFGEPKAFAPFNNSTLLETAIALGKSLSPKCMLVGDINGGRSTFDIPCHADAFPDCGPLGGIHSALLHSPCHWVAIIPCDMPLLSPAVYQFLYKFRSEESPVVAVSESGLEPLVSVWPTSCLYKIDTLLSSHMHNVRTCLERLSAREIDLPDSMPGFEQILFSNVNYKSDLAEIAQEQIISCG